MRNAVKTGREARALYAGLALVLVLMAALFWNGFTMTAKAESKGTVTASSARIRQSAGTNSEAVGSVSNGATVTIISEVQGSDGYTWYQIQTTDGTKGYIRSDLVSKSGENGAGTTTTPPTVNPTVEVEEVQPVGATITGGSPVRVRTDASTASTSSIITTLTNGTAITVNGRANGTDGHIWYLVTFTANNGEAQGFIRSDYVSLSGELLPVTTEDPAGSEGDTQTPEVQEPVVEQKPYDTAQDQDGTWLLYDYDNNNSYPITKLLETNATSADKIIENAKTIKTQKIVITILVILLVLAILAVALFFYKIRDLKDEAYFTAVEKQTLKERDALKRQGNQRAPGGKVMQTVGAGNGAASGNRPVGQKSGAQNPANKPVSQGNARPAAQGSARPAAQSSARPTTQGSARPATQGKPPVNAKAAAPVGDRPAPQNRPAAKAPVQQSRPAGNGAVQQRPAAPQKTGAMNPSQARPAVKENATAPVRTAAPGNGQAAQANVKAEGNQDWKTRNFMNEEDDEFEFEFLNWDGEEK